LSPMCTDCPCLAQALVQAIGRPFPSLSGARSCPDSGRCRRLEGSGCAIGHIDGNAVRGDSARSLLAIAIRFGMLRGPWPRGREVCGTNRSSAVLWQSTIPLAPSETVVPVAVAMGMWRQSPADGHSSLFGTGVRRWAPTQRRTTDRTAD
jgi:hypothetical protein